ncbi:Mov34/MPN/PAD-1 family protein [Cellulomonas triticagri]|uniref:Mov34/MPN/PAD-1 family protein n=1 Tax=Cellulomonas triticagri TaxID=2483352 RepID=UPI0013153079|nr:Mov34/MPN/PAD-1 family protein [Cellulomonas triticagri]
MIAAEALAAMHRAGEAALPRETGGILAGFRSGETIVVTRALLVADPASTHVTYELDQARAKAALDGLRADAPPVVGFVGDWHTHPRDAPPSMLDLDSLTRSAGDTTDHVALLVLPYTGARPGPTYARFAAVVVSRPGRARSRRRVRIHDVGLLLTDIEAGALELEAQDTSERAAARLERP